VDASTALNYPSGLEVKQSDQQKFQTFIFQVIRQGRTSRAFPFECLHWNMLNKQSDQWQLEQLYTPCEFQHSIWRLGVPILDGNYYKIYKSKRECVFCVGSLQYMPHKSHLLCMLPHCPIQDWGQGLTMLGAPITWASARAMWPLYTTTTSSCNLHSHRTPPPPLPATTTATAGAFPLTHTTALSTFNLD
jgi:hypothetical protein